MLSGTGTSIVCTYVRFRGQHNALGFSSATRTGWLQLIDVSKYTWSAVGGLLVGCLAAVACSPVYCQISASGNLTLKDIISQTLMSNPASLASGEQLRQAESAVRAAQAQQHFQLSFNSAAGVSNADVIQPPPSRETFGAIQNTLTIPLLIGPKAADNVNEATGSLSAAQASYRSSELALAGKAASAYFDLLKKRDLASVTQENLDTANQELKDAQQRNNAGDIPELDVLQAQVPVSSDQATFLQAQADAEVAQETLNDLLGRPLDAPLAVVDETGAQQSPNYSIEDARTRALAASADVSAAVAQVSSDEAARDAAKRFADPAVSLQAIDLRSRDVTSFSREDTLQASVTLPIDDGGLGKATVDSAAEALEQARREVEMARRATLTSVSSAYITVQSSLAEVAATAEAQEIAQKTYDKTRLGYENGLYPLVDAITAENALAQARSAAVESLYDAASARYILDSTVNGYPLDLAWNK